MKKLAVDKTQIVLETEYPWSWENGRKLEITIDASDAPLKVGGAPALAVRDVIGTIEKEISGRKYTHFMGSKPGTVSALGVRVDEASLLRHLVLGGGRRLVSSETKGEFAVSVSTPSTLSATPYTPDPLPMHFGKWRVENPKQQVCTEGGGGSVSTPAASGSPMHSSTRPPSAAGKREGKSKEEDRKPEEERKPRRLVFTVAMDDGASLQCVDIDAHRLGLCFDPPPDSAAEVGRLPWEGRALHNVTSMEEKLRNACRDWRPEAEPATKALPSGGAAAAGLKRRIWPSSVTASVSGFVKEFWIFVDEINRKEESLKHRKKDMEKKLSESVKEKNRIKNRINKMSYVDDELKTSKTEYQKRVKRSKSSRLNRKHLELLNRKHLELDSNLEELRSDLKEVERRIRKYQLKVNRFHQELSRLQKSKPHRIAKTLKKVGKGVRILSRISIVVLISAVLEIVTNPNRSPIEHAGRIVLSIVTAIVVALIMLPFSLSLIWTFVAFWFLGLIVYFVLEKFIHDPVMEHITGGPAPAQLASGTRQAPQFGSQPSSEWAEMLQCFTGHLMPGQCVLSGVERDVWGRPSIDDAYTLHGCVEKLFSLPLCPMQYEPKAKESRRRSQQSEDLLDDEISHQIEAIMEEMAVGVEEYKRDSEGDVGRLVDYLGHGTSVIEPAPEGIWEKIGGTRAECLCFDMPVLADRRSDRSMSARSRAIRVSIAATVRSLEGKILGKVDEEGLMNLTDDSEQFMDLLACLEGDGPPSRGAEYS